MLKIGEFAGLTGLSVKALRHYDEIGALVPADVDDRSAYRLYGESQVRAGVVIRALRDAGVPLPAVSAAISGGEAAQALETHRVRVLEQREREDRAFLEAAGVLRALAEPIVVSERSMPAQYFVGQVITVPVDDVDTVSDDDANEVSGALFARLQTAGVGPNGSFWTALRAGDRGTVEVVCCWPTPVEVSEEGRGPESFSALLPARTELVATWRPVDDEELSAETLHPAAVGLFDAIAERGAELGNVEVRQVVIGQSADDYAVELSVTVS
ncbi:MerR family DNA-binding transcriptional regulator [uncultured Leifsonia sp.]|uniref:MerR family DNA-binding transcriptional regulator n=1 Tax=uncultured Leifsonia sp. TaxID=340359 RepID=UPI0028D4E81A|nr:MerR family DNA-binding transcriptional regulator [uncultured Leifsonia sp.]